MAKRVAQAAGKLAKVLFENDRVRVIELNVKKGSKVEKHTHPDYFAYAVTPVRYKSTTAGGQTEWRRLKESAVDWREGETHSVEFANSARALVVELK